MQNGTNPQAKVSYGRELADEDMPLVRMCKEGHLNAFESLVQKHQKRMFNLSFRIIGSYDDAGEVVQDAFLSAYRNMASFRGEAKFSTWLTTITINLSRNRLKQMKSRSGHIAFSLDEPVRTGDGEMTIDTASTEPSVLDRMEQNDIRLRVQECIKALEPDFRETLVLRDIQEFRYDEIASLLTIAVGTVKSRIARGREAVKECLKKILGEL